MQSLFSAKTTFKINSKLEEWGSMSEEEEHANVKEKYSLCWRKACFCSSYRNSVVPSSVYSVWRLFHPVEGSSEALLHQTLLFQLHRLPQTLPRSQLSLLHFHLATHTLSFFVLVSHWVSWFLSILSFLLTPILQLAPPQSWARIWARLLKSDLNSYILIHLSTHQTQNMAFFFVSPRAFQPPSF